MAELRLPRVLQPAVGVLRRMAGARGRHAAPAGSRAAPRLRRSDAHGSPDRAHAGWRSLAVFGLALFLAGHAQAQVVAARIWPAHEYTRVTLETKGALKSTL